MRSYPKYKPSGIDGLSDIPSHWIFNYFKRFVFFQEGPGLRHWQFKEKGTKVICVTNITENGIDFSSFTKYISEEEYLENYRHFTVKKGDLLLASSGASWGKIAEFNSDEVVILNTSTIRLNSRKDKINRRFLRWLLNSSYINDQLSVLITGSCQPNFGPTHLSKLEIAISESNKEQQQIADFLDYKTEQCDRFIANRQKQIELLNEQKASIINKAVTKGINPNAKMKPSGIDWLPEVPADWDVWKMTRLCKKIGDGLHGTPVYEEGSGIFFINGNNLSDGNIEINENTKEIEPNHFEVIKKNILIGSILFSINGTIGSNAIYKGENILLSKSAAFFECKSKIVNVYLLRYLTSNSVLNYLHSTTEGTTIKNISLDTLRNLKIPLPSNPEQQQILDFIKKETSTIETLISKYQKQIELMQEYRTALISQAVTGKIDVREWKPKTK